MSEVREKALKIISNRLGVPVEKLKPENEFMKDLGADSLEIVDLVMEFEDEFEITIPDEVAQKIRTVGQAIEHIEQAVKEKG
ncbi:MAG: acyl carrier protein [Planctomycetota bacterium]|nr:MAG: acyl carrier protein [Planctomycetota bacterium]